MRITPQPPPVYVAYDAQKGRRKKLFTDPYAARRFYVAKSKAGKRPQVERAEA